MELRGCSQLHLIAVIRGGEVIRIPNLARGNPKLKSKSIEEIYFSNDLCHDTFATCAPKVDRSLAMPCGTVEVKTEVKTEIIEEANGLNLGEMTLRQIKDACKSHKRKASSSANLMTVKQEEDDNRHEVDFPDLKETLGSWKRKVLLKRKAKKEGIIKCNSMSSTTNSSGGRLEDTPASLDLHDVSSKLYKTLNIKAEDTEHDYSQLQTKSSTLSDEPGNMTSDTVRDVGQCSQDQNFNTNSGYLPSGFIDQFSHEHLVQLVSSGTSKCCLNQISYEHLTGAEILNPLISGNPVIEDIEKVDSSVVTDDQPLVSCVTEANREEDMTDLVACDKLTETESDSYDSQIAFPNYSCPLQLPSDGNASSKEHISIMAPNSDFQTAEISSPCEAMEMDVDKDIDNVVTIASTSCSSTVEFDNNMPSVSCRASPDNIISTDEDQLLSVLNVTTEEAPVPVMGSNSYFHDTEFFSNGEASRSMDDNPDPEANAIRGFKNCTTAVQDEKCLPLLNSVESLHIVTSAVEVNRSLILNDIITPLTCSPETFDAIDLQNGSAASERCYENQLEQQPPERLFSSRKTISPNSKERLHRAMNCAEIQDDTETLSFREKLFFEKNCVDTLTSRSNFKKARIMITSKRLEALRAAEIKAISRQTPKTRKYERKLSFLKGIDCGLRASPLSVRTATVCSSQSVPQNAIGFSQRQMIDTERLAMKLLTELQLMKEMVVDTLHPESRTCSASRSNIDKARVAVENVKKVEESTKKLLSTMSRDCNRFCKIMEVIELSGSPPVKCNDKCIADLDISQNNPVSETKQEEHKLSPKITVHREKKIMFADEAGESLCQVRVL